MKKSILFFIAILLSACASTPQVTVTSEVTVTLTVPSETSAPTATATPEPYMQSAPQFVSEINFEGDWKVAFDEEGNTVIIDVTSGDELGEYQEGDWIPNPEQVWKQEATDWKIDLGSVTKKYDIDGKIVIVDNATQETIYYDGYWNQDYMIDTIPKVDTCKKTDWTGSKIGETRPQGSASEKSKFEKNYFLPFIDSVRQLLSKEGYPLGGTGYSTVYLGDGCWATIPKTRAGTQIGYEPFSYILWKNENGQVEMKKVYGPKVVKINIDPEQ